MFRQDRGNPSSAVSAWKGRRDLPKAWPSTAVSSWMNGGLHGGGADTGSWHAIASTTLTSDTASVTFTSAGSSKPWSDYEDLVLIMAARGTNNGVGIGVTTEINDDSGNNYHWQNFNTNGGSIGAAKTGAIGYFRPGHIPGADRAANFYSVNVCQFVGINNDDRGKPIIIMDGHGADNATDDNGLVMNTVRWRSAAVITKFVMNPGGNFASGSQFDLYGIRAATG